MKILKNYIQFIKENNSEWVERTVPIPKEEFFKKWFTDKVKIDEDDNYITYKHHNKQWDEEENEYFWETEKILKVDKSREDITHYFEMDIINRPLYKIRDENMTREQELKIRSWAGTKNKPKYTSKYEGFEKGLAKFRSFLSNKKDGKLYHVLPNGDIVEMLNDDKMDDEYIESVINYLLDTKNFKLIDIVKDQFSKIK